MYKRQIQDNVRERDVFVVQSFTEPVSDHVMELLITLDALSLIPISEPTRPY